jgi:hypothetical protein
MNTVNQINEYILIGGSGLVTLMFGAIIWFVQRLIKTLDRIDSRVYQIDNILASSESRLKTVEIDVQRIDEKLEDVGDRFLVLETEHRTCVKCHPVR